MSYKVYRPKNAPLSKADNNHADVAGLDRVAWLEGDETPLQLAIHTISDVADPRPDYCIVHTHADYDEINLIENDPAHPNKPLKVRFTFGEEEQVIEAPASITIPAGMPHAANVVSGCGTFTCIRLTGQGQYKQICEQTLALKKVS